LTGRLWVIAFNAICAHKPFLLTSISVTEETDVQKHRKQFTGIFLFVEKWSRGSSVGIATRLRAGRPGFDSQQDLEIFLFPTVSRTALGPTQPPVPWVPGALSLGVKRPGREANHSPPSSAEVKNVWTYTSTPPYAFMAWCLQDTCTDPIRDSSVRDCRELFYRRKSPEVR
jgi:hypothetical protein